MDNSNRQMFPFDDALHVHQAGTVRPTMYSAPVAIWSFTLSRPMQTDTACSSTANIPRSRSTRQYGSVQRLRYLPQDLANHATYCNKGYSTRSERN